MSLPGRWVSGTAASGKACFYDRRVGRDLPGSGQMTTGALPGSWCPTTFTTQLAFPEDGYLVQQLPGRLASTTARLDVTFPEAGR